MDPKMYNQIVVGKKGIVEQRVFISKYFPEKTKLFQWMTMSRNYKN